MKYWLYSIDWRSAKVRFIGGFCAHYQAELARAAVIERASAAKLAEIDKYITFGIATVNESIVAAFSEFVNRSKEAEHDEPTTI
jgi:hypothetical protein